MKMESMDKKELIGWAYVRVSTAEQSNVLHGSVEQQQNRIKRWEIEQTNRTGVVHRITRFIDEDISGRAESLHKRREYHELIMAIKKQKIDFVVVEKLDRLHRNIIESRKFIDLCDEMGIKFYRLDGGLVDLKDRSSRTSVFIESWMAEEYSLDLVEKLTKKGREARVNNGKDNQSMPILGLDEHPTEACFYTINREEQKIVTDIFRYFCSTGDLQKTANYCNKKGYRTKVRFTRPKIEKGQKVPPKEVGGEPFERKNLRALLVNRKIAGFGYFKDDWHQFEHLQDVNGMVMWKFRHGPVIEPELFEEAQVILRKNAKFNHRIYKNQRTYILSGILFDTDGTRLHGENAKNKNNFYYVNSQRNYRIRADYIEEKVVKYIGTLLRQNGILEKALNNLFHEKDNSLKKVDQEISVIEKKIHQHEQALQVMSARQNLRIIESPEHIDEILFELVKLRKENEMKLLDLNKELEFIYERKEEMEKLSKQDDICAKLKKSLEVFHKSSSPRKKKLMELMVPKLVVDRKRDELNFYINPLLDKSLKNSYLPIDAIEPVLVLKPNFQDRKKKGSIVEDIESIVEKGCHIEEKSSCSGRMAGWTGLEPAASGVTGRRYNQLNYHPKWYCYICNRANT
jgi:DNA invertase Pin-like site-specific DNA recombinase